MKKVYNWANMIQSWLLPRRCLLCGAPGDDSGLCAGCLGDLPRLTLACETCALPIAGGHLCRTCGHCLPPQDEAIALFHYAFPVDGLIQRLKFHEDLACARLLGRLMAAGLAMRGVDRPDCLLPVPLHRARLARRGFNQAVELARPIARTLGVPLVRSACRRVRATAVQSALDAGERGDNLRGAFALSRCPGSDVAIIDDVMTTGHTAGELARVLKAGGVERVRIWVCARATDLGCAQSLW